MNEVLLNEIRGTLTKKKVDRLAAVTCLHDSAVPDLLAMTFHDQHEIAFRAAWILEYVLDHFPEKFIPHLKQFLSAYPQNCNTSCQRHYTKMLVGLTRQKIASEKNINEPKYRDELKELSDDLLEPLVEASFTWLIASKTPVAVKANCLDVLHYFSHKFNWIKSELDAQIGFLLRDGSPALQKRGRRILNELRR